MIRHAVMTALLRWSGSIVVIAGSVNVVAGYYYLLAS
jgi:hypothetical protein